jgi:hypothetical protein
MFEIRIVWGHFILICVLFFLPGCQKPKEDAEYSWQRAYTEEFLNYQVQEEWLIEQVTVPQFLKQAGSTRGDDHIDERVEWFVWQHENGDFIWRFMNPLEMWENLEGVSGFVLIHNGKQIATFITNTSNIEMFLVEY